MGLARDQTGSARDQPESARVDGALLQRLLWRRMNLLLLPEKLVAQARKPAERALRLHPLCKGKVQMMPKCPISSADDFSIWYSPGVAAPCQAIQAQPDLVYDYTNTGNCVAIVSDGTRVLGLGDIGPEAGLPVMEGKSLLF